MPVNKIFIHTIHIFLKAIYAGPDEERINDDAENPRPSTIDDPTVNLKKALFTEQDVDHVVDFQETSFLLGF